MTKLEELAKDCIENHTHKLVDKPTKQDIYLREESIYIQGYRECEKRIPDLELKIKKLTQYLEPQEMTALFEQVEEEVEQEQRIVELEKKISILLSCKNCPDNKGGYICKKEYERKCLSQKIQYIKELQEENKELKEKLKPENCLKLLAKDGYIKFSSDQLTYAKTIIQDLLGNTDEYARQRAEDFLKENK